jgi:hypothetical protein
LHLIYTNTPLLKSAAERATNHAINEAQRRAKEDRLKKERIRQEKWAHGEDTTDEEEEEGEEERPPTITDEPVWDDLANEGVEVSLLQLAEEGMGPSQGALAPSPHRVGKDVS